MRNHLVIMVKAARAGAVKSRLAREVGVVAATQFYRHTSAKVIARLAAHPRWETMLSVTPDTDAVSPLWPRGVARMAQGGGDLGARMQGPMDVLPPGPVIVVGTDIPAIRPAHIARAFRLLGGNDAVLGPAGDGGFWLVGLRRVPRVLRPFDRVRWSGPHALGDTLANLHGARVAFADEMRDVDTLQDMSAQQELIGRRVLPA